MGDLKDKLGIKHRKEKKNRDPSPSNLEAAPMFHEQHSRSMSELSVHNAYEPTEAVAPATPLSHHGELSPLSQQLPLPSPKKAEHGSLLTPPSNAPRFNTPSPQPSYYSASDIPPPSPLPPTQYRLTSGEITTTPPSTVRSSLSSPPSYQTYHSLLHPPTSQGPTGLIRRLSGGKSGSGSETDRGVYEMQVRSPPVEQDDPSKYGHAHGGRSASSTSYTSYATAADDFWTAEDEPQGSGGNKSSVGHGHQQLMMSHAQTQERDSEETTRGGEDDRDTIVGVAVGQQHDRRTSAVSVETWEMGRAM